MDILNTKDVKVFRLVRNNDDKDGNS